jgi:branched-chain amino acid transport system permease protein
MRPILLILLAIAISAIVYGLGLTSYSISILIFGCVNALLCLGFYVIFGLTGILSLAHAAFMAIGAYVSGILAATYGLPLPVAIVAGTLVAAATGALLGIPTLRLRSHYLVLVTVAFGEVVRQLIVNFEAFTGGVQGFSVPFPSPVSLGRFSFDPSNQYIYLLICLLSVVGAMVACQRLRSSRIGRSLEGIRDDELAAGIVGVNTTYFKVLAFVISAALAGFGGALYAHFTGFLSPDHFTFETTVLVLAMVVVGGKRSIPGVVIGAMALTIFPEVLRDFKDWYPSIYGIVVLLTLWLAPNGLAERFEVFLPKILPTWLNRRLSLVRSERQ